MLFRLVLSEFSSQLKHYTRSTQFVIASVKEMVQVIFFLFSLVFQFNALIKNPDISTTSIDNKSVFYNIIRFD